MCNRGRGPGLTKNGVVKNIFINNLIATGPYEPWEACIHDYYNQNTLQSPEIITSSITGNVNKKVENIILSNVYIEVPGGETDNMKDHIVPDRDKNYPENHMYGKLPAYGLYCRHCKGLTLNNVKFKALENDFRDAIVLDDVTE